MGTGISFITPSISTTTTYYVDATDGVYTSTRTAVLATISSTPPSAPANTTPSSNQVICSGNSTVLSVSGTGKIGWYSAATGGIYLGGGADFTTPVLTNTTTYYAQDSACGASATRTSIEVTVNLIPSIATSTNGKIISSNQDGATYQWVRCINGTAKINGANKQSYSATTNGNYAVIVTLNGCPDISSCVNIINVGIPENSINDMVSIFPNPAGSSVLVSFAAKAEGLTQIDIINPIGNKVLSKVISVTQGNNNITLSLDNLTNGIYFMSVTNEGLNQTKSFMVEK
jgi:hypothetical protein